MVGTTGIRDAYNDVRTTCRKSFRSAGVGNAIATLVERSLLFLAQRSDRVALTSAVPGKTYFTFARQGTVARPVNRALFSDDIKAVVGSWRGRTGRVLPVDFARTAYTVALAPCLALELLDRGNKKGPATYFECLVGHIFATSLGAEPERRASLPILGRSIPMTMDFLFNTVEQQIHLPVKMSTRERVVQAWSHQRILDTAHGEGSYRGLMVLFSETKLDSRKLEVVEICVPDQWLIYQTTLAHMDRIYYFDMPVRYRELTETYPDLLRILPFGDCISELAPTDDG